MEYLQYITEDDYNRFSPFLGGTSAEKEYAHKIVDELRKAKIEDRFFLPVESIPDGWTLYRFTTLIRNTANNSKNPLRISVRTLKNKSGVILSRVPDEASYIGKSGAEIKT